MTGWRWLGLLLIVLGIAMLLVAPQAQSCVAAFDHTSCRATGTILLKVVGLALVAAAAAVLALRGTATDR
jgi:drug/metabolite transporter (DMT)-like permease